MFFLLINVSVQSEAPCWTRMVLMICNASSLKDYQVTRSHKQHVFETNLHASSPYNKNKKNQTLRIVWHDRNSARWQFCFTLPSLFSHSASTSPLPACTAPPFSVSAQRDETWLSIRDCDEQGPTHTYRRMLCGLRKRVCMCVHGRMQMWICERARVALRHFPQNENTWEHYCCRPPLLLSPRRRDSTRSSSALPSLLLLLKGAETK